MDAGRCEAPTSRQLLDGKIPDRSSQLPVRRNHTQPLPEKLEQAQVPPSDETPVCGLDSVRPKEEYTSRSVADRVAALKTKHHPRRTQRN
jgi:hypothetical protein